MKAINILIIVIAIAALIAVPRIFSLYYVTFMFAIFMYCILSVSWNMISGYTGYVSLGHVLFFGLGGYSFAMLMTKSNFHWMPCLLSGGVFSSVIALGLGYILLSTRIRVAYFAMITLGLNEIVRVIVTNSELLGEGAGIMVPLIPSITLGYYILLFLLLGCLATSYVMGKTAFGLGLRAIRQDEEVAECGGVNTAKLKISAFVLSAFFPGVAGATVAWNWSYIDPRMGFDLILAFYMVIMAVIGGIGTLWGPILGACFLTILTEALSTNIPYFHKIILGLLVIFVVIIEPGGLINFLNRAKAHLFTKRLRENLEI